MTQNRKQSCNGCYYEYNRTCYWFEIINGSNSKIIPTETFDKGCKQYKNTFINYEPKDKLIIKVIDVFKGEIIGEKYTPNKWVGNYKKKKYTTKHNYTKRKDF